LTLVKVPEPDLGRGSQTDICRWGIFGQRFHSRHQAHAASGIRD